MSKEISPIYEFIGKKIKDKRRELKLSQKELADKCGLNRASVLFIEKGVQQFSIERLYSIARSLGMDVSDLLPSIKDLPASENIDNNSELDDYSKKIILEKEIEKIDISIKSAKKLEKGNLK